MTALTDLSRLYDEPIDPATIDFTTKPGKDCKGCLFQRQKITVCNKVEQIAEKESLPKCDDVNIIYVAREVDPRQLHIEVSA